MAKPSWGGRVLDVLPVCLLEVNKTTLQQLFHVLELGNSIIVCLFSCGQTSE